MLRARGPCSSPDRVPRPTVSLARPCPSPDRVPRPTVSLHADGAAVPDPIGPCPQFFPYSGAVPCPCPRFSPSRPACPAPRSLPGPSPFLRAVRTVRVDPGAGQGPAGVDERGRRRDVAVDFGPDRLLHRRRAAAPDTARLDRRPHGPAHVLHLHALRRLLLPCKCSASLCGARPHVSCVRSVFFFMCSTSALRLVQLWPHLVGRQQPRLVASLVRGPRPFPLAQLHVLVLTACV